MLTLCTAAVAGAQQPPSDAGPSLDSLLSTRISAPSKYAQTAAESPASVTILTSEELRHHGFRNLQEALESVRGFYISNDRNYAYLGTRGFSRPTDYNNRVLLLIDGHTINEHVWGMAPIGSDLPVNLASVERIEIVRGPGSAMYGTSAMFAVINIVTKTGAQLDGISATARVASAGAREMALTVGRPFGTDGSYAFSALVNDTDGDDLYFAEFDAPQTNDGVVSGLDWERGASLLGNVVWRDLTVRAGLRDREKGIPTASYDSDFGDRRTRTRDESIWADVTLRRELTAMSQLAVRAYLDRYRYVGVYPYGGGIMYSDRGQSSSAGGEVLFVWDPTSRQRMTLGTEFRSVIHAEYVEVFDDGTRLHDDDAYNVGSFFAEHELQLTKQIKVVAGGRLDQKSRDRRAVTPRSAIVLTPDARTTIKLLYGKAFRAPSPSEADITTSVYTENPDLEPERITTTEVELQRRLARALLATVSAYDYRVTNLIDQVDTDSGIEYRNVSSASGRGVEAQLDIASGGPLSAGVTYALQRAIDRGSRRRLTNSPAQIVTAAIVARLSGSLRAAATMRHETGRTTVAGTQTDAFARADLNVEYSFRSGHDWLNSAKMSVRASNLFDVRYATPGGFEHRQAAIEQDGRSLSLRIDWQR